MINFNQYRVLAAATKWRKPEKIYRLAGLERNTRRDGAPIVYALVDKGLMTKASRKGVPVTGSGRHTRLYKITPKGKRALEEFYMACVEVSGDETTWRDT